MVESTLVKFKDNADKGHNACDNDDDDQVKTMAAFFSFFPEVNNEHGEAHVQSKQSCVNNALIRVYTWRNQ